MRLFRCLWLGLAMSVLGVTSAAAADGTIFYTVTYVEVIPPSVAPGAAMLRQYGEVTRRDTGALRVEIVQRTDRPNQFVVLVAWADPAVFEAHQAAPSTRAFHSRLQPLLASPNDLRLHHGLSVDPTLASVPAGSVYVVTHVDVIPPRKDDAVAALKQLAEDSRKHPRHVRFDVVQQTNRPNHFTVIEVWRDRRAFDTHGMTPQTKRFREELAPMSGALYDERLYQALE